MKAPTDKILRIARTMAERQCYDDHRKWKRLLRSCAEQCRMTGHPMDKCMTTAADAAARVSARRYRNQRGA